MRWGVALGRLNPALWQNVTVEADRLGFESVWLPEHLVLPLEMVGSPFPGEEHPPVPPSTPVFDAAGYLCHLAALTTNIRLGTWVYLLGLRHPFVAARAFQTLDLVSGGRAELGVGAGWLKKEWHFTELEFSTRGRRLDEAIAVCRRLWDEEVVEHHGEFFDFGPVMFEPKPVQHPLPIHVGGESPAALRRAVRHGQGWIGMAHTVDSAAPLIEALRRQQPPDGFQVTVGGDVASAEDVKRWEDVGVDRLIVSPWHRSPEAIEGLHAFAGAYFD